VEDFSLLENIVQKNIAETKDPKKFNVKKFVSEMEQGFTELGFREQEDRGVQSILVFSMEAVGDFVVTIPAIREIRKNFPFAKITLVVSNRNHLLSRSCPYVNDFLIFNERYMKSDVFEMLNGVMNFCKENLWKRRYSLTFVFRTWPRYFQPFMAYLSGAKERVAYVFKSEAIYSDKLTPKQNNICYDLLTHPLMYPKAVVTTIERDLYMLKGAGLQVTSNAQELWFSYSDLLTARRLLSKVAPDKVKVIAGISTTQTARRYPVKKYLPAFQEMAKRGAMIIIIGGPGDRDNAKYLEENLPADCVLNLAEISPGWNVDIAMLTLADMYIGNMSGACDAAYAAHIPIIAVNREPKNLQAQFAGNNQLYRFFPWQTETILCLPKTPLKECWQWLEANRTSVCNHNVQPHCITQIKPEEIVEAYAQMVNFLKHAKKFGGFPTLRNFKPISGSNVLNKFKRQKNFSEVDYQAKFAGNFDFVKGF